MKLFIGTSGWSYDHWVKEFYPVEVDRRGWLSFYCNFFNTVEVNMSFYRFPFPNLVKSWYSKTPKDFNFTFKGNRLITHVKKFEDVDDLVKKFYSLVGLAREKLGCVLWQLPPSMHFSPSNLNVLDKFLKNVEGKNVVEFRHKSWWRRETYDLLRGHDTAFCVVSCPSLPPDIVITSGIAYIRFHGIKAWYRHDYTKAELAEWAERIKQATEGCKEIYCYFNNDYNAYAPKNGVELRELIENIL
jgi:uncharacterized protein YecE (DUF72 family)